MRKKKIILCALLLLCLLLTGCHGKNTAAAFVLPDSFDTQRQHEITFWAKNDTNMTQVDIYKAAIEGFEKAYPNVKVNLRLYTDYGRIYQDVITNIATNTTPNVCITYPDHIATYLTGGTNTVVPLEDFMGDEQWGLGGTQVNFDAPGLDEVVPKFLEECQIGGVTYALPYMRSTEAVYVNKTYVEKLGYTLPETLTWDFVWEVSEAAMKKDAQGNFLVNGQKVMIPFIYKSTDNMMIQYLDQKQAGYSSPEGEILIFNDDTRAFLKEIAVHGKSKAFSTFKISSYPANFLNAGQCIFAVDSTAGATWMGSDAPLIDIAEENLVAFETAVMTIPQLDAENPSMISQGPSVCIFNKEDPQEVLASWLFMQYLLTNDVQIAYAQTEGYVPVTLKAQQSDTYQDYLSREGEDNDFYYPIKLQASRLLIENTENTFVTPVFNGSASLRDAAGQMIENVTKAVNRRQTVDEAFLDKLFDEVNALYRLDQTGAVGVQKDLGALPGTAVTLLVTLVAVWVLMGLYVLRAFLKKKKAK
ncbi:MAG: extracellular solute-binding protein [Clostridia bacterium]|nr:extracellular solute-binding protein [Clostridia bacterium]